MPTYGMTDDGIFRDADQLSNFSCTITQQIKKHDGKKCDTFLVVNGKLGEVELPEITIPATQFGAFNWVSQMWGMLPIIFPLTNSERDLKCAIQTLSSPETVDMYTHTGWTSIGGKPCYLHGGGGVSSDGNDPSIHVELPNDLKHFRLSESPSPAKSKAAFRASLNLVNLGPANVSWPMVLAAYRAAVDETDFAMHLSGRTGTFKSEFCSLIQSHFGAGMDARHLPASWSSTANALECQCYRAKDAVCVIDDFVPTGTSWQMRGLQKTADQLLRGQGNQAGRARLTDTSQLQQTYYPRGIILSTGEDIPAGHSIRARMLIVELSPGDIDTAKLTAAQDRRPCYPISMYDWVKYLSSDLSNVRQRIQSVAKSFRDGHRDIGHARTPQMAGQLQGTLEEIIRYAMGQKYLNTEEAARLAANGEDAIVSAAAQQALHLRDSDPSDAFLDTIRAVLGSHLCHLRSKSGGIPDYPTSQGWTEHTTSKGMPGFRASGPTIGWVDRDAGEVYIDQNQFGFLQKHANGKMSLSRQTMLKRLKDSGTLARTDELRQRNTMRVQCGGAQRSVITIPLTKIFEDDSNE